ncbi:hypothetical protein O3P69_015070 [Scylla paramamosain]|uniref:Iron-binding zinc finger CDGSH type domain-containing protein n=1 Tax=Scylla paramamosain TaxID=85552 RepID=A0AAW0T2U8_SCYPA
MATLKVLRMPTFNLTRLLTQSAASHVPSGTQEPKDGGEAQEEWKQKGRIHSKKSVKVNLVGGKRYLWCACGYSKNQPFCDGTHLWSRFRLKIKQHPVFFKAPKDMTASLCLCKQTNKPPYCDGTHRRKEVQEAVIEEPK